MPYDESSDDWWEDEDGYGFSDPGGRSALRAASGTHCPGCRKKIGGKWLHCAHCGHRLNPRIFPCPTCGAKNVLTRADVSNHYQCDRCADRDEGRYIGSDY